MASGQSNARQGIEARARFNIIRYSNCWEDADILLDAVNVRERGRYLSIASAGDNTFSLLSRSPSLVLAIDISPAQLACTEVKKIAFAILSYEEILDFLGLREGADRSIIYKKIRENLSPESKEFWDRHTDHIKRGLIHMGKFEGYFRLFRNWILPLVHGRREVSQLLAPKDKSARVKFYIERWNSMRWRTLFKIFFSRPVMGHFGRDPEFFRYVDDDVAAGIMRRAEYALTILPTDSNPYLEYILTGNFKMSLPHYLRKENFDAIRGNLDKLKLFKGNLSAAYKACGGLKFDGFNLSDIFEYMSQDQYSKELEGAIDFSNKNARLVYWNMLSDRKHPAALKDKLNYLDAEASSLFEKDKAFFYKSLIIEEIK